MNPYLPPRSQAEAFDGDKLAQARYFNGLQQSKPLTNDEILEQARRMQQAAETNYNGAMQNMNPPMSASAAAFSEYVAKCQAIEAKYARRARIMREVQKVFAWFQILIICPWCVYSLITQFDSPWMVLFNILAGGANFYQAQDVIRKKV